MRRHSPEERRRDPRARGRGAFDWSLTRIQASRDCGTFHPGSGRTGVSESSGRCVFEASHRRSRGKVCGEGREAASGPALLLVGAEDESGLYIFRTWDAAGALSQLLGRADLPGVPGLKAFGIHAFLPKPFGAADALRVVWAVCGFDERKKGPAAADGRSSVSPVKLS